MEENKNKENQKAFYNKVNEMTQFDKINLEMSNNFKLRNKPKWQGLEESINEYLEKTRINIQKKCGNLINRIFEFSETEILINDENNDIQSKLIPKLGKEEEFNITYNQYNECTQPIQNLSTEIDLFRSNFNYFNTHSYNCCMNECRFDFKISNDIEEAKYCINDCFVLGKFNLNAYSESIFNIIKYNNQEYEKI